MIKALINLSENANRVLNIVKARNNLKDKSQAMELVINHYIDCRDESELKKEYLEKLEKIEKEDKRIRFKNISEFDKHFGVTTKE